MGFSVEVVLMYLGIRSHEVYLGFFAKDPTGNEKIWGSGS